MSGEFVYRFSHSIGTLAFRRQRDGLHNPMDLAVDHDGSLWILNRGNPFIPPAGLGNNRINKWTPEGEHLFIPDFGLTGQGDDKLVWPVSLAIDGDGNIYISDEGLNRISVLDSQGQFLRNWGVRGQEDGEFDRPAGIAFDTDDNLLVADGLNCRIQRYTKDGQFLGGWGRQGSGDGELNMPWGITVDKAGDVYVADWRNDRIQKFDADGNHLATFGTPGRGDGEFHRPAGAAVDEDGNIYVADWGNERVQVLGPDGSFIAIIRGDSVTSAEGMTLLDEKYFFVGTAFRVQFEEAQKAEQDFERNPIKFDSSHDESGTIEKLLWGPSSVKLDSEGRIYIADSLRARIQVYRKEPVSPPTESITEAKQTVGVSGSDASD